MSNPTAEQRPKSGCECGKPKNHCDPCSMDKLLCEEYQRGWNDGFSTAQSVSSEISRLQADLDMLSRSGCRVREHNGHRFVEIESKGDFS